MARRVLCLVLTVMLNPDCIGTGLFQLHCHPEPWPVARTGLFQDLIFNRFRVKHGMTFGGECHAESRLHRDQHLIY
jgi:hypothetical protein